MEEAIRPVAICYNCGIELTNEIKTREHVPAQNLYEGFNDEFKKNRITVPACRNCNEKYSKIDHELRDVIAIKNDDPEQMRELTGKGVRSIFRKGNWKDRVMLDLDGNAITVNFSYSDLMQFHVKNFKAIFYRKYGFILPSDFKVEIVQDGDDTDEKLIKGAKVFHEYLITGSEWEISGHEEVFKFIMKDITEREDGMTYESRDFDRLVCISAILVYHNSVAAIVVAAKEEFLASLPNHRK